MTGADLEECVVIMEEYDRHLTALHDSLMKCDIRGINESGDELMVIEIQVLDVLSQFERQGFIAHDSKKIVLDRVADRFPRNRDVVSRLRGTLSSLADMSPSLKIIQKTIRDNMVEEESFEYRNAKRL